jgi:nucleoside-diphosphate-sugar epimerase
MMVLLTGASGFVGKAVLKTAQHRGLKIRPVYRSMVTANGQPEATLISGFDGADVWSQALKDVHVVIHTAALAHVMRKEALHPLAEYRRVNVQGTLNLARQAAAAGVQRFVFISSIKVNGEGTVLGRPFTADDNPAPEDAYGLSKAEAEFQLKQVAQDSGMELTIIRPPLIYGAGVKGNMANLIGWVKRGLPLPFGWVTQNRRSLVGLDNLVDLILVCTDHLQAANQTFLISDGEDLSTSELLRKIGKAVGRPAQLLPMPIGFISMVTTLLGKRMISDRLLGTLQVDINKTCELLDWRPSVSIDEGLRSACG